MGSGARFQLKTFRPRSPRASGLSSLLPFLLAAAAGSASPLFGEEGGWKAGAASITITPREPMWMAGYAARTRPAEGKIQDLHAKALALDDGQGRRLVIVTADLIAIPRSLREDLERRAREAHRLPPEALLINASHTHCGPELRGVKALVLGLEAAEARRVDAYHEWLKEQFAGLVDSALAALAPARLSFAQARAGFAMNRRVRGESGYGGGLNPDGPVDHDVPVLRVEDPAGSLRAVLFGYACHNTTLNLYRFSGDYAGHAQEAIEEAHPGAVALFLAGCGGDQDPQPRRGPEDARRHGLTLATAVEAALLSGPRPVRPPLRLALGEAALEFAAPPSRDELLRLRGSGDAIARRRADLLLAELERRGALRTEYPCPVQVARFGGDLTLIALGGEAVVDYSLRLKRELSPGKTWVAAYSNDVFGYLPSRRVLEEGGYEAGEAMRFTDLPGPFASGLEDRIVAKVRDLLGKTAAPPASLPAAPATAERSPSERSSSDPAPAPAPAGGRAGAHVRRPGIEARTPWRGSRVRGSPDPPHPYRTEPAFPALRFEEPLELVSAQGNARLFVAERYGRVYSFPNDSRAERADLLLDLNAVLGRTAPKTLAIYGLAFHPRFEENRSVFVTYVVDAVKELPLGTRVSRFRVTSGEPPACDPGSEEILLRWSSGGHNGGCLVFGPDGFLYVGTGDSSGIADEYETGQDLATLPGAILRIDVDRGPGGMPYAIPPDNPFVGLGGARAEIWAYGLRQPWKLSFDPANGDLWTGNVGQDLWEQVYRIERGGNYGWSITEGSHPFRPERRRGPTPILPPIVEHGHADFRSITGGFVYRGTRLEELRGAYVYGDYDTGRVWMLRYDREARRVVEQRELVDTSLRLVGFGEDRAGELYLIDHTGGQIHRLARNAAAGAPGDFPRRLSGTGLFASVKDHRPAPGLIPYSIAAPSWVDGAHKEWFLALPDDSRIEFEAILFPQPAPGARPGWKFPEGTVLVETISLDLREGDPSSRRRLETRLLHHERLSGTEEVGDQYWHGYSYVWSDDGSDATLLEDPQGLERSYEIQDPGAPGGKRLLTWRFPARSECTVCHNLGARYVLGLNTLQANVDHDYAGKISNQLFTLEHLGVFTAPLPTPPERLPRLPDYRDERETPERRARSYLHASCSHCHRKWGGGNADFILLATLDLGETGAVGARPMHGSFEIRDAAVLFPGDPARSVLFHRMATLGPGRMPRLGSSAVDRRGLRLIHDWIRGLPGTAPATPAVAEERSAAREALDRLRSPGASATVRTEAIGRLLGAPASALELLWAVESEALSKEAREEAIARGSEHPQSQVRDLFERFLPEEKRKRRLGSIVRPEEVLALAGEPARGKETFESTSLACRTCHRIGDSGGEVGPDLSQVGKRLKREQILESILSPSKAVDPRYAAYAVETRQGQLHLGILVERTAKEVVLRDAQNKLLKVPAEQVKSLLPQEKSLMPELLFRDLTAPELAGLIDYLSELR